MTTAISCNTPESIRRAAFINRSAAIRVSKTPPLPHGGVSELYLTARSPDLSVLLLPLLARLCRDDNRWITWICPSRANRQLLQEYGVDIRKVRFVTSTGGDDQRWVLWEALHAGTSNTVIADGSALSEEDIAHLDEAARAGNCRALLIRRQ